MMKKAVMYGAGKIGRGFIGQKFYDSGYEVCFLDAVPQLVDLINSAGEYGVFLASNEGEKEERVENVVARMADSEEGLRAIRDCDVMATAVGARNLEGAADRIAAAVEERSRDGGAPLNIILAENQMDVDKLMRSYLNRRLSPEAREWADANLGLVAASIQRMVPQPDAAHLERDPLCVVTEAFSELPVDADAIRGEVPAINGLVPFSPFSFQEKRKLFMHNMAHALTAYLAYPLGYEYIWQAMEDETIRSKVRAALQSVAEALSKEYDVPLQELEEYAERLLERFSNRALGDTVLRVGADPVRKLRPNDRLTGAALYVAQAGVSDAPIVEGIASALRFNPDGDASSAELAAFLEENEVDATLARYIGEEDPALTERVAAAYARLTA